MLKVAPFGLESACIKSWCTLGDYPCLHFSLLLKCPPVTELCGPFDLMLGTPKFSWDGSELCKLCHV